MIKQKLKAGYVYLLSVLAVGTIASSLAVFVLDVSIIASKTSLSLNDGGRALAAVQACIEEGLLSLVQDNNYAGGEVLNIGTETCEILLTGGSGNENRYLCAESTVGIVTRRVEVIIQELLPQAQIYSWQEVSSFSACSYP